MLEDMMEQPVSISAAAKHTQNETRGSETEMGNCLGKSSEVVLPSEDTNSTIGDTPTKRLEMAKSTLPKLSEETDRLTGNDMCDSKENLVSNPSLAPASLTMPPCNAGLLLASEEQETTEEIRCDRTSITVVCDKPSHPPEVLALEREAELVEKD